MFGCVFLFNSLPLIIFWRYAGTSSFSKGNNIQELLQLHRCTKLVFSESIETLHYILRGTVTASLLYFGEKLLKIFDKEPVL